MFFQSSNENIRYTGRFAKANRWGDADNMTATAPGSSFEFAFKGDAAQLYMDVALSNDPKGHVYIEVDGGARIEATIEKYMRIVAKGEGPHHVRVIYKSTTEYMNRWFLPLATKLCFKGVECNELVPLAPDNRKTLEVIGDSITEGVLVTTEKVMAVDENDRPWQDDATSTYGWLLSEKLDCRYFPLGYGASGVTHGGLGCIPKAIEQYPYMCDGVKNPNPPCDYILINHGANDRAGGNKPSADYIPEYEKFLKLVREMNPDSKIVVLSPFCGAMDEVLPEFVERFNRENDDNIYYISSKGWVPLEPLHPLRAGHKIIADRLYDEWLRLGV